MSYLEFVSSAERIGLPKGEANENYRKTFEQETQLELPITKGRKLSAKSQGRTFFFLRSMDMPARVDEGLIDIGICGTDAFLEYPKRANICSQEIGEIICRFSILAFPRVRQRIDNLLNQRAGYGFMQLPTSRPNMLNLIAAGRDLPFAALDKVITGSVEEYPELTGIGAAADIVSTGETYRDNGLIEVRNIKDIRTTIAWKV